MNPATLLAIPAIPAVSALLLALFGRRLPYAAYSGLAVAAVAASFALALGWTGQGIFGAGAPAVLELGSWIATQGFQASLGFRLDSLGLCMVLLVTGFGTLITLYSVGYMSHDREQVRFFASINLFVASMLVLVLADNLALIFLGWEGVGLCSYLLIGHYWDEEGVPLAAFRAFFVNRIGDILFLLGVFTLFSAYGTLSLSALADNAAGLSVTDSPRVHLAALLLLGGAFAKSAQAPLHVWLADAMAGPTPVSALIHAATMVTAGIYLVARLDWLYAAAPEARVVLGLCALVTLVVGAFLALVQTDIKKLLAYSTLSNLALMFLGLSVGASQAGLGHLFGHAFFKALLFLSAGSIIFAAHHEQDIRKLQGSLSRLPVTRIAVWVGCIGGAGLIPYFAAGFFTKEAVLVALEAGGWSGFGLQFGGHALHYTVMAVESLSAIYMFRLLGYLTAPAHAPADAHGHEPIRETSWTIRLVLGTLALAAPVFGTLSANAAFSGQGSFWNFITGGGSLPEGPDLAHAAPGLLINLTLAAITFWIFVSPARRTAFTAKLSALSLGANGPLSRKFYFDDVYATLITTPLKAAGWLTQVLAEKIFTGMLGLLAVTGEAFSLGMRRWQTGKAQHYALYVLTAAGLLTWFAFRQ